MSADTNFWIVYHTRILTVHGKFYLEKDARKKMRKLDRNGFGPYNVEWISETTLKQWKLLKVLQS